MLIATKKNRQLRIPDGKLNYYSELGYTIKDEKGKVVYKPRDVEEELREANAQIKKLTAENEKLKKAQSKQTASKKTSTKKAEAEKESAEEA